MAVDSKHPQYGEFLLDWQLMRDSVRGERFVKLQDVKYLPATSGMTLDGMGSVAAAGRRAYDAYKARAYYPDLVSDAVEAMLGIMHNKPPVIEVPDVMKPLLERCTLQGESLQMLLRRINQEQLITGRTGLLVDLGTGQLPYIALYTAETILNWDIGELGVENLNLVILDETEFMRTNQFEWNTVNKYRVLILGDTLENELSGTYRVGVFKDRGSSFNEADTIEPSIRGQKLDEIPFTFINSKDINAKPDDPPLLGLARLCMTIYRGEADYRQSLFLQGQDTLVVIGANAESDQIRIGAGGHIQLPLGGDAKFIGVSSSGLPEQRQALASDYMRAYTMGAQLLTTNGNQAESGDALRIRVSAKTATLNQIALTGAFGLQNALRQIAKWIGTNPDEVTVKPNLDFADDKLSADELVKLISAKNLGAPISNQTIHDIMRDRDMTSSTFEEELARIEEEEVISIGSSRIEDNNDQQPQ